MKLLESFNKKILFFLLPISMLCTPSVISMEKNTSVHSANKIEKRVSEKISLSKKINEKNNLNKKPREIKVNIALDGVSKKYSKKLVNYVSEVYRKEFNISFKIIDFYKYKLPDRWRTDLEMEKVRSASKRKSDIYLLFSSTDWDNPLMDSGNYSILGESQEILGYAWIEKHDETNDRKNLTHEISHLFGLDHLESENSFMHKKSEGEIYFTEDMKRKILENKFREWKFSKNIPHN